MDLLNASEHLDAYADIFRNNYVARKALIFYEINTNPVNKHGYEYSGCVQQVKNFVTIHDIRGGEVCEGHPVTRIVVEELVKHFVPNVNGSLFLPENVIMLQPGIGMAWWIPSSIRKLYFDKETKIESGRAPVPALLFMVRDNNLCLWALGKNTRPVLGDPVYHAPFFNLSDNGIMCTGNVCIPEGVDVRDIPKWQGVVFRSKFSNHGRPHIKGITGKGLWDSLIGKSVKTFPMKYLVKAGTVKSVLRIED